MHIDEPTKLLLLQKATDIAIQAANAGVYGPDLVVEIIDKTYNKLISLAEKA